MEGCALDQRQKLIHMTTEPVNRLVAQLAVPTVITMLVTTLYNMADTYFVGTISQAASGAVGVIFSFMAIIQAVGFLFGHGSGNYISRQLGHGRPEAAQRMASVGFFLSFFSAAALAVPCLIFIRPLAIALGSTDTILPYAIPYLRCILLGMPFMISSLTLNNQLRFQGSAVYGMVGMVLGAVLNIAGDPILIYGFDLGILGAGISTMVSQIVGFCVLLLGCTRGGNLRVRLRQFRPTWADLREIFRGGLPSLCRQGIASVSTVVLNWMAKPYGDAAIAAMGIVSRYYGFVNAAVIGLGQGFQPVCGFNYGAGLYDRVKQAFRFCVKLAAVFLCVLAVVSFVFAPQIVGFFRRGDTAVIDFGTAALRFQAVSMPAMAWIMPSNMMMQNIGCSGRASFLALARQGIFLIPALLVLTPLLGKAGLQSAQTLADLLTLACSIPLQAAVLRRLGKKEAV